MTAKPATVDTRDAEQAERFCSYLDKVLAHRVTPQVWKWEYGYQPDKLVLTTLLSEQNDLVGSQNFLPIELVVNGALKWTVKSENTFVNAAHRGGGTFKELYEYGAGLCRQKNIQTIWGYTAVVKAWRDKLGFAVHENWMHSAHLQLGLLDDYTQYGVIKGIGAKAFHAFSAFRNKRNLKRRVSKSPRLNSWKETFDNNDVDQLLQSVLPQGSIRLAMHGKYFEWRVKSNPNVTYRHAFLYDSTKALLGYYIYSIHQGVAYLAEAVYKPEAKQTVWSKLSESLLSERVSSLHYFANVHHPWCRQTFNELETLGARTMRHADMNFVVRTTDPDADAYINNAGAWYMNALWTEGFRM